MRYDELFLFLYSLLKVLAVGDVDQLVGEGPSLGYGVGIQYGIVLVESAVHQDLNLYLIGHVVASCLVCLYHVYIIPPPFTYVKENKRSKSIVFNHLRFVFKSSVYSVD